MNLNEEKNWMKRSAFCELLRWSLEGPELTTGKFSICFSTKQNPVLSTSESGAFDDRIFDRKATSWRSIGFRREVFAIFKLIRNDSNRMTLRWWETVIFASKVQMFANFRVSSAYAFFVQKKSKQIEVIRFETLVCNPMILGRHWAESGSWGQIAVDWRQLPVCHSVNTATRAAVQVASWSLMNLQAVPSKSTNRRPLIANYLCVADSSFTEKQKSCRRRAHESQFIEQWRRLSSCYWLTEVVKSLD